MLEITAHARSYLPGDGEPISSRVNAVIKRRVAPVLRLLTLVISAGSILPVRLGPSRLQREGEQGAESLMNI